MPLTIFASRDPNKKPAHPRRPPDVAFPVVLKTRCRATLAHNRECQAKYVRARASPPGPSPRGRLLGHKAMWRAWRDLSRSPHAQPLGFAASYCAASWSARALIAPRFC